MNKPALAVQHGGGHYKGLKIQPVEFIMSNLMGFCEGNVVKYVTRWRTKGGIEDLRKAKHFLQFLLESPRYMNLFARMRAKFIHSSWRAGVITCGEYIKENGIQNPEAGVIRHIEMWNCTGRASELAAALKWMDELLAMAEKEPVSRADPECPRCHVPQQGTPTDDRYCMWCGHKMKQQGGNSNG